MTKTHSKTEKLQLVYNLEDNSLSKGQVCRVWQSHTRDFHRVFKKDNREQRKFLFTKLELVYATPHSCGGQTHSKQ